MIEFGKGLKGEITATGKIKISLHLDYIIGEYMWVIKGIIPSAPWKKVDIGDGYTLVTGTSEGTTNGLLISHNHTGTDITISNSGDESGNLPAGLIADLYFNGTEYKWVKVGTEMPTEWIKQTDKIGFTTINQITPLTGDFWQIPSHSHDWKIVEQHTQSTIETSSGNSTNSFEGRTDIDFVTNKTNATTINNLNFIYGLGCDLYIFGG